MKNEKGQQHSSAENTEKLSKKLRRAESSVKDYQFLLIRFAAFLFVIWLLFFVFIGVTHMTGDDMYPRLDTGDLVLFYRLDKDVAAQDIIVIERELPGQEGTHRIVSRVVAVAGDTVEITDDEKLVINGNTVVESKIFYTTPRYEGYTEYPLTLGEGECFVLADHREGGTDSRFFGAVTRDQIEGTVIAVLRRNNL